MSSGRPNILVIKLGALGDFIQALGPCRAIRKHHEEARIVLLTTRPYEDLARQSGYFDEVWVDDRPKWTQPLRWIALRRRLNGGHFERVYDLQNNDRTSLYFKLFSPRPEWVGVAPGASHRNASPERTKGKAFDGHVQTLALAGIRGVEIDRLEWMAARNHFQNLKKPYVLIVPGSAPQHPHKRWAAEKYGALCRTLGQRGYQCVLIGTEAEKDVADSISSLAPNTLNLTGKTSLFDLPPLAFDAAGAIGNDTGPMHLIAPTGCRTIVLFSGKSQPHRHAPKGARLDTLQKDNLNDLKVEDVLSAFENQQRPE